MRAEPSGPLPSQAQATKGTAYGVCRSRWGSPQRRRRLPARQSRQSTDRPGGQGRGRLLSRRRRLRRGCPGQAPRPRLRGASRRWGARRRRRISSSPRTFRRNWLKVAPDLYEDTVPWPTPAALESWGAPAQAVGRPWRAGGPGYCRRARPDPPSTWRLDASFNQVQAQQPNGALPNGMLGVAGLGGVPVADALPNGVLGAVRGANGLGPVSPKPSKSASALASPLTMPAVPQLFESGARPLRGHRPVAPPELPEGFGLSQTLRRASSAAQTPREAQRRLRKGSPRTRGLFNKTGGAGTKERL